VYSKTPSIKPPSRSASTDNGALRAMTPAERLDDATAACITFIEAEAWRISGCSPASVVKEELIEKIETQTLGQLHEHVLKLRLKRVKKVARELLKRITKIIESEKGLCEPHATDNPLTGEEK